MAVKITAPDSAAGGTTVDVSVGLTNDLGWHATFRTEIYVNDVLISTKEETISSGSYRIYPASFSMPNTDALVFVWVEHWAFDHWEYFGADSKTVVLIVAEPEFSNFGISEYVSS